MPSPIRFRQSFQRSAGESSTKARFVSVLLLAACVWACADAKEADLSNPQAAPAVREPSKTGPVLYLQFGEPGGAPMTLVPGTTDDSSTGAWSILGAPQTFLPFELADQSWKTGHDRPAVIEAVRKMLAVYFGNFDVRVVTERPLQGKYTMIVVGALVGSGLTAIGGRATLDCDNKHDANVGVVTPNFSAKTTKWPERYLARLIAHEAGHTFGLMHVEGEIGIMVSPGNPNVMTEQCVASAEDCDIFAWVEGAVVVKTGEPTCPGRSVQSDVAVLQANLVDS